jgi:hypothetical protein
MPADQPPTMPPSAYFATGVMPTITSWTFSSSMAVIHSDGRVEIDWKRAEGVAAPSPDDRWRDKTSEAIAKVMLSIRDKTYTEPDKAPLPQPTPQPAPPGGAP